MVKNILWFGGESEERLVSVASAQNLTRHFNFHEFYFWNALNEVFLVSKEELLAHQSPFILSFLPNGKPLVKFGYQSQFLSSFIGSRIFLGFHGGRAENGELQSYLESHQISFTGSGAKASQWAFNKAKAKDLIASFGGRVPRGVEIKISMKEQWKQTLAEALNEWENIVIKPNASGSSFGLQFVANESQLNSTIQQIEATQDTFSSYLCEERIVGRELTVGYYSRMRGGQISGCPLPPSEVILERNRNFDYQGKYLGSGVKEVTPAELNPIQVEQAQELCQIAHQAVGAFGYSRTDMILTDRGEMVFLEINTLPGLSGASFIPQQLAAAEVRLPDFIEWQLELAESRFRF